MLSRFSDDVISPLEMLPLSTWVESIASLGVADILRAHGHRRRKAHQVHFSLAQLKVMSAIETCHSAAFGGHVLGSQSCQHHLIAYNSCRNQHSPKWQGSTACRWLEARQADSLPVDYYHLLFTLPTPVSDLAYCNKSVIYTILLKAAERHWKPSPLTRGIWVRDSGSRWY